MAAIEGIGFRPMTPDDEAGARDVIYEAGPREPLFMGLGLKEPSEFKVAFDLVYSALLGNGLCYCAYDTKTGAIVGTRLCIIARKDNPSFRRDHPVFDVKNPKTEKMAHFEIIKKSLRDGIDIFEKYNTDVFIRFGGLYVKGSYGKRGIGCRLVEEALNHVHRKGYNHVFAEADSIYSLAIFRKLNFELLAERHYDDMYENGKNLITHNTGDHKKIVLCVKALEPYVGSD